MRTQYILENTSVVFHRNLGVTQYAPLGVSSYVPRAHLIKEWDVHRRTDDLREQGIIE